MAGPVHALSSRSTKTAAIFAFAPVMRGPQGRGNLSVSLPRKRESSVFRHQSCPRKQGNSKSKVFEIPDRNVKGIFHTIRQLLAPAVKP